MVPYDLNPDPRRIVFSTSAIDGRTRGIRADHDPPEHLQASFKGVNPHVKVDEINLQGMLSHLLDRIFIKRKSDFEVSHG
jgi:hypothetical protein